MKCEHTQENHTNQNDNDLLLQIFLDLNVENVLSADSIIRGSLIGRGAFGFVFKATLNAARSNGRPRSVAMKMLQPVQPGVRTGKVHDEHVSLKHHVQHLLSSIPE